MTSIRPAFANLGGKFGSPKNGVVNGKVSVDKCLQLITSACVYPRSGPFSFPPACQEPYKTNIFDCGFYAMDIATLKPEHLSPDGTYVVRYRNKTHVPTKHLLWPLTARLIAACRTDRAGLLFNRKGSLALVVEHCNDGKKYDSIANRLRRVSDAAGALISFSQLRDTSADLVERNGATGAGMIDRALVDQFLGRADSRMAKHYITSNPLELETTKLDDAIRKLEQTYALDA